MKRIFLSSTVARMSNALHLAMHSRPTSIIPALLQKGVNQQNHVSDTPLHIAVKEKYHDGVRLLLSAADIDRNIPDTVNRTPLSHACENGDDEAVRLLLAGGGETPKSNALLGPYDPSSFRLEPNHCDMFGYNPLAYALSRQHSGVTSLLLASRKIDSTARDLFGRVGLHWAAKYNHVDGMKELLKQPKVTKFLNHPDKDLNTPLDLALVEGHGEMVDLLIAKGQAEGVTLDGSALVSLHLDAKGDKKNYVELLLDDPESNLNVSVDREETPLICWAVKSKDLSLLKRLLARSDINVNAADWQGNTPLIWCTANNLESESEMLLSRPDLDVNVVDRKGKNALHHTAHWGDKKIMEMILARPEANFDALDDDKCTPLHFAAHYGKLPVVEILLAKYSNGYPLDRGFHKSPLYFAIQGNSCETVEYLLDHLRIEPGNWVHDALFMSVGYDDLTCFNLLRSKFGDWMAHNPKWKLQCLRKAAKDATDSTLTHLLDVLREDRNSQEDSSPFACSNWYSVSLLDIVSKLTTEEINTLDNQQQTALHVAAAQKDMRAVRVLITMGADFHIKNGEGRTADECIREGYSACSDLLEKHLFNDKIRSVLDKGDVKRSDSGTPRRLIIFRSWGSRVTVAHQPDGSAHSDVPSTEEVQTNDEALTTLITTTEATTNEATTNEATTIEATKTEATTTEATMTEAPPQLLERKEHGKVMYIEIHTAEEAPPAEDVVMTEDGPPTEILTIDRNISSHHPGSGTD
jgi:ankyrin repeat protein